jgi:cell division protein FtsB
MKIGINWHLKFRQEIDNLKKEVENLKIRNAILKRKLTKYENNNIRTTGNRQDNNSVESGGRIYTKRN